MLFLDILAEFLAEDLLYNKVKDYLAIRKGDLKDSAFEKFYKTLVVRSGAGDSRQNQSRAVPLGGSFQDNR